MKGKEVLNILKVTRVTLCNYVRAGKIRATKINTKILDYNEDDVYKLAGIENRKAVIYARVSTQKQKSSINTQIEALTHFANTNGVTITEIYTDVASGLSFDRGQFQTMLLNIINHKIKTVYITDKDRLSRVSFDMWKQLFLYFGCNIIIMNDANDDNNEKEIFSDIISLIHCFAMKMYSKRRKAKLKLIEENLEIEQ